MQCGIPFVLTSRRKSSDKGVLSAHFTVACVVDFFSRIECVGEHTEVMNDGMFTPISMLNDIPAVLASDVAVVVWVKLVAAAFCDAVRVAGSVNFLVGPSTAISEM